jgi:predicted unusual protein kinase regulating ubiquinone biosynthesis (AarF/ABC1/UbiB family)
MKQPAVPASDGKRQGVIAEMPRRQFLDVSAGDATLSQMRFVDFESSRLVAFRRLLSWINLILVFSALTALDWLIGRDTPARRAQRLRSGFERRDGVFVKLGMHLAARIDFLPWVYCNELARMTDRMEPFPIQDAIAILERCTHKPLPATFTDFDPQPILSTAVACSYQAVLRSGEKVIVKVRRPGIGPQLMADVRAFNWLLSLAEAITIFHPGFTQGLRSDFRELLLEELDFLQEGRRQDAFRRAALQSRKSFFSAPRVYLELSNEEVVVNEFASGVWLWELLAAVEQGNETVLAQAREMNIDPKKVARRLLWINDWAWQENLFFHSDPQPNNIIVGPESRLHFINFTNTGALNRTQRQAMRQILSYARQRDPQNMARASLILMEPLPPIDVLELTQELENYDWQIIYALEAKPKSLAWQERTSAILWTGILRLARKHGILINIQVLRLLRATLLSESMAARLHPKINYVQQYWKFNAYRAEQARRRVTDTVINTLDGKSDEQLIIRLDRIAGIADSFFLRTRHLLSLPSVNFNALSSKSSYAFYTLIRFVAAVLGVTALAVALVALTLLFRGRPAMSVYAIIQFLIANPVYQAVLLLLVLLNGRTVLFRLDDREASGSR